MYTTMLGLAAFLDWYDSSRAAKGIFWFATGGIIGWPFAAVLVVPFVLEELFLSSPLGPTSLGGLMRILNGGVRSLIILVGRYSQVCSAIETHGHV